MQPYVQNTTGLVATELRNHLIIKAKETTRAAEKLRFLLTKAFIKKCCIVISKILVNGMVFHVGDLKLEFSN